MTWTWTEANPTIFKEYTTAERDALGDPPDNLIIYNTTTSTLQFYNGFTGTWNNFVTYFGTAAGGNSNILKWNVAEQYYEPKGLDKLAVQTENFAMGGFNIANVGDVQLDTISAVGVPGIIINSDMLLADEKGLVVGHNAQLNLADLLDPEFQVLGTDELDSSINIGLFSTTNLLAPILNFIKSGDASIGGFTSVADDEELGKIQAYGADGTDLDTLVTEIAFNVDDVAGITAGAIGGEIVFKTATAGGTLTTALTINKLQQVTFEQFALFNDDLTVLGDFSVVGTINAGVIFLIEQADADADVSGSGQLWVDTATPNALYFTNDVGKDVRLGTKHAAIIVSAPDGDAITTGDGKVAFRLDSSFDNMDLIEVGMSVTTVSSSGLPTIQLRRSRKNLVTSRTIVDILSTKLSIDVSEFDSNDATTAAVINATNEDMAEDDVIFVDIDIAGTGTKGLCVTLVFAAEA